MFTGMYKSPQKCEKDKKKEKKRTINFDPNSTKEYYNLLIQMIKDLKLKTKDYGYHRA